MSDDEKSKDGKGKGGCFGCFVGCGIILALLIAFFIGFFIIPALRDNKWSFDVFPRKIKELRTRIGNKIDDLNYRFIKVKDEVQDEIEHAAEEGGVSFENVKQYKNSSKSDGPEPLADDDLEADIIIE